MIPTRAQEWLDGPYDAATKAEIVHLMETDPKALQDAFYTDLSFGTGGLRGLMGVGSNRMNIYTVRKASQGLAQFILKESENPSVFISYDSRHHSKEFALEAAHVFAGNGIKVFLVKEMRPTPFVSFGVRELKCTAGVMITASHNPAEYNGYKVYGSDGGQVVFPKDRAILQEMEKSAEVKLGDAINYVGRELDEAYLRAIAKLQHFPDQNRASGDLLKISYTSLHGTGITLLPEALKEWGFRNLNFVESQIIPDGDFPTVKFPNPEYKETLELGILTMQKTGSDLLIATDPDADRVGVVVRHEGNPVILNGNEVGALCVFYLCLTIKDRGNFVISIVTTELIKAIADSFGKGCVEVLTGFKYIGALIEKWHGQRFIFGAEESYGYLLGSYARDKDGISASCLIAEMALQAKLQKKSLVDILHEIYARWGIYREGQRSVAVGSEKMKKVMLALRKESPEKLAGLKVVLKEDYIHGLHDLPPSDMLLFRLEDESKIVIRPSGTEPKIKIYGAVKKKASSPMDKAIMQADLQLNTLLDKMVQNFFSISL